MCHNPRGELWPEHRGHSAVSLFSPHYQSPVLGNKELPKRPSLVSPAFDMMTNSLLRALSGTLYLCHTQHTVLMAGESINAP